MTSRELSSLQNKTSKLVIYIHEIIYHLNELCNHIFVVRKMNISMYLLMS